MFKIQVPTLRIKGLLNAFFMTTLLYTVMLTCLISIGQAASSNIQVDARTDIQMTAKATIVMDEFSFYVLNEPKSQEQGSRLVLDSGKEYELTFINLGKIEHEFLFGRDLYRRADGRLKYREHFLSSTEVEITGEFLIDGSLREFEVESFGLKELELDPGLKFTVKFTVPKTAQGQEWEFGCLAIGHHEAGMFLPIHIK